MSESSTYTKLKEAAEQLNSYASKRKRKKNRSPIAKTIDSVYEFFRSLRASIKYESDDSLLAATEVIRNQRHLLIQLLKEGSPEERRLAESVNQAVIAYNKRCQKNLNFSQEELSPIDLLIPSTVKHYYPPLQKPETETVDNKTVADISHKPPIDDRLETLFRMKVVALLRKYKIVTIPESYPLVQGAPILTLQDADPSKCELKQTLSPLPGITITIKGASDLNPKTKKISRLFPETFSVTFESTQTGFPHPLQRSGWALSNQLLPECPKRLDLLNDTIDLFSRKKRIIYALLHRQKQVDSAKQLLQLNKEAFNAHQTEFLILHQELANTILKAAGEKSDTAYTVIKKYFSSLLTLPNTFETLANTYQYIRDEYISKPHTCLLNHVLNKNSDESAKDCLERSLDLVDKEMTHRIQNEQSSQNQLKWKYVQCLGSKIGRGAKTIILQYFSEDLNFPPPVISLFEQKLQVVAIQQCVEFIEQLSQNTQDVSGAYNAMKQSLISDINVFKEISSSPAYLELSLQLEQYYNRKK